MYDICLLQITLLDKLMRIAHEDGSASDWLLEMLEQERESVAAMAACALLFDREKREA